MKKSTQMLHAPLNMLYCLLTVIKIYMNANIISVFWDRTPMGALKGIHPKIKIH